MTSIDVSQRPSSDRANVHVAGWIIFSLGVLALFVGPFRISVEEWRGLTAAEGDAAAFSGGTSGFVRDGVFVSTKADELPPGLRTLGSWVGSDEFQGTHVTGWFRAAPRFTIMVAGYPLHGGNRLELELRRRDGTLERSDFVVHNSGEQWWRWPVELSPDVTEVRIRATDANPGAGGWLAFSEPFTSHPRVAAQIWSLFQLLAFTCLALTVLCGPGLLWFIRQPRPLSTLAFAILPGAMLLAALGLICWIFGGILPPAATARIGILVLLAWMGWQARRHRGGVNLPYEVRVVVTAGALLVGFAVAKANVSFGPAGELFRDRVSRTLAVGNHSDSQISFHVVQTVAHHLGPYADQTKIYFAPWRFASRGPLAGWMAAPLVLASGADVPFDHPTHPWRPFDRQGFAVYRIACIVLASLAAWVVFAVAAALTSPAWGVVAAATAMLAPFFVHEIYFSWPKLISGALVLVAFLAAYHKRPFVAGVVIGLGYLFHPLAALSAPFLGLWVLAQPHHRIWWRRVAAAAWCVAGVLVLVIPWQMVGRLRPDETANQDVFLHYFFLADSVPATASTWWKSRWDNLANTFVPGYLFTADPKHDSINSLYGPSDGWVRASFIWWNTFPFALGVPGFVFVAAMLARACRRAFVVMCLTVLGPALLLIVYWGAAKTGLMRQCGHALFLSSMVAAVWTAARWPDGYARKLTTAFLHPASFAWRGIEIALMAFGTTLLNRRPDLSGIFGWNDLLSLLAAAGCLVGAVVLLAHSTRANLRSSQRIVTGSDF